MFAVCLCGLLMWNILVPCHNSTNRYEIVLSRVTKVKSNRKCNTIFITKRNRMTKMKPSDEHNVLKGS